ncbi:MAG: hypothetical protein NVS2B7_27480 [Herpetosiphon sp.]
MLIQTSEVSRIVAVRLNPGDDVLESLRTAVDDQQIKNGLILNGVGSLNRYRVHVVGLPTLPTQDVFVDAEGPFDILTFSGAILEGRVHAHITFSNTEKAMGGHLEIGCRVLTFSVIVIAETPGLDLTGWDTVGAL